MTVSIWHLAPGSWLHGAGDFFSKYIREGSIDMPHGVAMCKNAGCASREGCYRFIAEPAAQQFYGHFTVPKDEDKCVYYIDAQENLPFLKPEEG